jgi:hypothetical protein
VATRGHRGLGGRDSSFDACAVLRREGHRCCCAVPIESDHRTDGPSAFSKGGGFVRRDRDGVVASAGDCGSGKQVGRDRATADVALGVREEE